MVNTERVFQAHSHTRSHGRPRPRGQLLLLQICSLLPQENVSGCVPGVYSSLSSL